MLHFFYGSLMDAEILALVLGRDSARAEPASLAGWRRVKAAGAHHPLLVAAPGEAVAGVAVEASPEEARRIVWYESKDDYEPRELAVTLGSGKKASAVVFLPRAELAHDATTWEPESWQAQRPALLEAARRWMASPGAPGKGARTALATDR